jgi:hypothetical protein
MFKSLLQIQPEWQPVVAIAKDCLLSALVNSGVADQDVLGVYLRGSVAQGTAVQHISDLDIYAYILIDPQEASHFKDATCSTSDTGLLSDRTSDGTSRISPSTYSTVTAVPTSNNDEMQGHSFKNRGAISDHHRAGSAHVDCDCVLRSVADARAAVETQFPFCTKAGAIRYY